MRTLSLPLLLLLPAISTFGLVNDTDPTGNTSAPTGTGDQPTDPGFANIGQVNGSSGVYLGDGWVLTANHVGAGTFNLGGTSYSYNGTDSYQIGDADLRLFKLSTTPAVSGLSLSLTTPLVGAESVLISGGRTPAASTTTWYVDSDVDPWLWDTESFPEADRTEEGYTTSGPKTVRWGTNLISGVTEVSYSGYTYDALYTNFTESGPFKTDYEAQAVTNDSGGALFVQTLSGWELAGILTSVGNYDNQPGGANSALYGNLTYAVNLADYATEINSIIPEPQSTAFFISLATLAYGFRRKQSA